MSKVTLNIEGRKYEVSSSVKKELEGMHRDFIEELKALNDSTPPSGALDGPLQRLTAEAQSRYRQRLKEFVLSNIGTGGVTEVEP